MEEKRSLTIDELTEMMEKFWEEPAHKMTVATNKGGLINYQISVMEAFTPNITQ